MAYVLPQTRVFQELELIPVAVDNPLRACIIGPNAHLIRFGVADEQELGFLGAYDPLVDECYLWPNRPVGASVDFSYTKVYAKDALLKYFDDPIGSGSNIVKLAGSQRAVRSDTINFATNIAGGVTYARDAAFIDRDVQIGDTAFVRAVVGLDIYELWTSVRDLIGDAVASVIDPLEDDANNAVSNPTASTIVTKLDELDNCIDVTADATLYDGAPSGYIDETYTIRVIQSSVGSDATTARLRVFSASGTDDQLSVTPAAFGAATAIGTRGLEVTFDLNTGSCSIDAANDGIDSNDLVAGQEWQVVVNGFWENPQDGSAALIEAGTYTGSFATTYIIEITKGANPSFDPGAVAEFTVTTTTGVDVSGPTALTPGSLPLDFPVGTKGVLLRWDTAAPNGFRKGDKYYITVTPELEGPMRTIVLANTLNSAIPDNTPVDLQLYIKKPTLEIPENRLGFAPLVNWTQSATEICIEDGIEGDFDSTWTDGGVIQPLPLSSGDLYVEYRAWDSTLCGEVNEINDVGQLSQIPGPTTPDNLLKQAIFHALQNSGGVEVKYIAVCDPDDLDSWLAALEVLIGRDDLYGLVPTTRDNEVLQAVAAHVASQSTEIANRWRVGWFNLAGVPTKAIVNAATSDDSAVVLATITDDPNTSGTQYTRVLVPGDNSLFLTNGVRAGDIVRALFTTDGFGNELYTEFVVDDVLTENELLLVTGPGSPIGVAQKIEVWRNLRASEEAEEIGLKSASWASRRIRSVWPDTIGSGGVQLEGWNLCAALSGLTSAIVPHQGMTRLEVVGFDNVDRTIKKFNSDQLNRMAELGTWIVTRDFQSGTIYTRHAVTTAGNDDLLRREEVITRNLDALSFDTFRLFDPFIGIANVTPTMIDQARAILQEYIDTKKSLTTIQRLGPQLIEGVIERVEQSLLQKDKLVVQWRATLPAPLNNLDEYIIATV